MAIATLLAPTERKLAEKLAGEAIVSSIPEEKGADVLIYSKHGIFGLQRKEVPHDFVSSMYDGRLTRETDLLAKHCQFSRVICEGRFKYYPDTTLVMDKHVKKPPKKSQVRGMLLDISVIKGVQVDYTEDLDDTVLYIRSLLDFIAKEKHYGLYSRPGAQGQWIKPSADEVQLWLLQGFPGIGPAIADSIVERFGKVPLEWSCTLEELQTVQKLSKKRATEMFNSLSASTAHRPADILTRSRRLKHA